MFRQLAFHAANRFASDFPRLKRSISKSHVIYTRPLHTIVLSIGTAFKVLLMYSVSDRKSLGVGLTGLDKGAVDCMISSYATRKITRTPIA